MKYKQFTFSSLILVVLILGQYFGSIAQAIPSGQRDCEGGLVSTSSGSYEIVPNTSVTVNNGDSARSCVIQLSTEVLTSAGDGTALAYTIDSTNPANCIAIGATAFHVGNPYTTEETNTHIGVRNIAAGSHTIRPCFATVDLNGGGAFSQFESRCLIVECRTK